MLEPALIIGGAALAAPWWWHHRARPSATDVDEDDGLAARWARHVADPGGPLPGSRLELVGPFAHGDTWRVLGVPGRHYLRFATARLPAIASGLGCSLDELVVEADPNIRDTSVMQLQHITRSPIRATVLFEQPRCDGGVVLLGPHADGVGEAGWRLYSRNSMWGGFVLGSQGSGKSRLIEIIALTAQSRGDTTIFYVDGQDGASSAVLWRHAAMRAGTADSDRVLAAVEAIMRDRQRHNVEHELAGFTPSPQRPGILIVVDEAHAVLPRHARLWASIARTGRKVGVAVLGADQHAGLKGVFGELEELRSTLLAGNAVALRTASRQAGHLLPGLDLDPFDLPTLPGYGYLVAAAGSGSRTAPFRVRYLPDRDDKAADPSITVPSVQEWFERIPAVPLDAAADTAVRGVGPDGETGCVAGAPLAAVSAVDEAAAGTMADRLLELIMDRGGRMELPAIYTALPGESLRTIRYALKSLVDRGALARPGEGIYELSQPSPP